MKDIHILLVKDNEGEIELIKEGLSDAKIKNKILVVKDGDQYMRFVNAGLNEGGTPLPDLILLNNNLPKVDGKEVLHPVKINP